MTVATVVPYSYEIPACVQFNEQYCVLLKIVFSVTCVDEQQSKSDPNSYSSLKILIPSNKLPNLHSKITFSEKTKQIAHPISVEINKRNVGCRDSIVLGVAKSGSINLTLSNMYSHETTCISVRSLHTKLQLSKSSILQENVRYQPVQFRTKV